MTIPLRIVMPAASLVCALFTSGVFITSSGDGTLAQIVPDTTLGTQNSKVTPITPNIDLIRGGATRGINLFHSFIEFNVGDGHSAYFASPPGILNILSRVTGNNPSNIFGKLGVNGNANLFLINPNGIIFGPNATLDVRGSFLATTANAISFGNLGLFSATAPNVPSPLLRVNPSALLFNQIASAAITSESIAPTGLDSTGNATYGLRVPDGRSLLLVGGDVSVNGLGFTDPNTGNSGGLKAFGGRIELGGLAGTGSVGLVVDGNNLGLSFPAGVPRTNVSLTNGAQVNVMAGGGGSIAINAFDLNMAGGSQLEAGIDTGLGSPISIAGNIEINATGVINLTDGSVIGNVVNKGAKGNSGNLTVNASNSVQLIGTSADDQHGSGLFASTGRGSSGNGGELTINTGTLLVRDGAVVSTSTHGTGNSGNLTVNASNSVQLIGTTADGQFPSALAASAEPGSSGNGGELTINTPSLLVRDGAQVGAGTFGTGNSGSLTVNASNSVQLIGTSADGQHGSGLFASAGRGSSGNGGDLTINTPSLLVGDGAVVSVGNPTRQAGNLTIQANSVRLNRGSLLAQTALSGPEGGANITLKGLDLLRLDNESLISANAFGQATGGNITIDSTFVVATPPTGSNGSDITANAGQGNGGAVNITTQGLFGIQFRPRLTPKNDITVSSDFGLNGTFQLNTPGVDPSRGLSNLPTQVVDASRQIGSNCAARGSRQENSFTITGTGGLPPRPGDPIDSPFPTGSVRTIPGGQGRQEGQGGNSIDISQQTSPSPAFPNPALLVEATGWMYGSDGEVVLTAQANTATPHSSWSTPPNCLEGHSTQRSDRTFER